MSPESPHPNPIPILAENGPIAPVLTVLPFPIPCNISVPAQPGSLPQSLQNGLMLFQGLEFSSAWSPTPTVRTLGIRLGVGGGGAEVDGGTPTPTATKNSWGSSRGPKANWRLPRLGVRVGTLLNSTSPGLSLIHGRKSHQCLFIAGAGPGRIGMDRERSSLVRVYLWDTSGGTFLCH